MASRPPRPPVPSRPVRPAGRAPEPETLPRVVMDEEPLPRFHTDESAPVPDVEAELAKRKAKSAELPSYALEAEPEEPFDAAPTKLRDDFAGIAPTQLRSKPAAPRALHDDASLDDVVEELREATGNAPARSELSTSALTDDDVPDPASSTMEVDVKDLVVDRAPPARDLWNVRTAEPRRPLATIRVDRPSTPPRRSPAIVIVASFVVAALLFGGLAYLYLRTMNQAPAQPAPSVTSPSSPSAHASASAPVVEGVAVGNVPSKGKLELGPTAQGSRVLFDDTPLTPKPIVEVPCGVHTIKVGERAAREVDVPCGGAIEIP